jgi:colanic acid biosynthesis glycosyl transferase WcaI
MEISPTKDQGESQPQMAEGEGMKIALAASFSLEAVSGTPIHSRAIANTLRRKGAGVVIIQIESRSGWVVKKQLLDGIPLYNIPLRLSPFYTFKILRKERPEVITAQTQGGLVHIFSAAWLLNIPVVFEVHGLWRDEMKFSLGRRTLSYFLFDWGERFFLPQVANTIVLSERVRSVYLKEFHVNPKKIHMYYPGVPFEEFQSIPDVPEVNQLRRELQDCITVMYAGSLYPAQGVGMLLGTVPKVLEHHPEVRFVILGADPPEYYAEAQQIALPYNNKVLFLGEKPYHLMPAYFSLADILVIPRPDIPLNRVSPRKMGEYMATGKAIVATDVADFRLVFEKYQCGMVTQCNSSSLAAGIIRLAADSRLRKELGDNARQTARRIFDFDVVVDRYLEIYRESCCQ